MFKPSRPNSFSRSNRSDDARGPKKFGGERFTKRPSFDRGGSRDGGYEGGRDGGKAPAFDATCGGCGKDCKVPFRPVGDRPVYCTNCFKKQGGPAETKRFSSPSYGNKPAYREERPTEASAAPNAMIPRLQEQLRMINTKLDAILSALEK